MSVVVRIIDYFRKPKTAEQQYLELCKRIIKKGEWVENERTGKRCLTVLNVDLTYDVSDLKFPLITTRKAFWRGAIAEMIGYLRGYDNAQQFADIGCNTWFANANETAAWLANPLRKGENDLGRIYGVQARRWKNPDGVVIDQFKKIIDQLKTGKDNRRLIMTFHNPGELDQGALDACMHTHHFSVLNGKLYLTSYQRSSDVPLGLTANFLQTCLLLRLVSQIVGIPAGKVFHKITNAHIYEDQLDGVLKQIKRKPHAVPTFHMSENIKSIEDIETWIDPRNKEHFWVEGYKHHEPIKYPMAA